MTGGGASGKIASSLGALCRLRPKRDCFPAVKHCYTVNELTYFIQDSGAAMVICDPSMEAELSPIAAHQNAQVMTLDAKGGGSLTNAAQEQSTLFTLSAVLMMIWRHCLHIWHHRPIERRHAEPAQSVIEC